MTGGGATARVPLVMAKEQTAAPSLDTNSSERASSPNQDQSGAPEVHHCGMCGHNVGNDAIGCDRCSSWVHPTEMCSGLPNDVIRTISTVSGDAILFVCTNCRVKPSSPRGVATRKGSASNEANLPGELIQQLFLSVKGICSAVMELTARMDRAFSVSKNPATAHPDPSNQPKSQVMPQAQGSNNILANTDAASPVGDYRSVIRQEMKEMQERAKRRQSIIIKGIHAQSARDLVSKFGDLSQNFAGERVELSDIVPIANHSDLFRAKVLNDEHRRLVLDRAKTLKDTDHATVFIRRDLTFAQRKELRERRARRNGEDVGNAERAENQSQLNNPLN